MNGAVSRRSFMKIAGIGAASLAVLESLPAWAAKLPVVSSPAWGIKGDGL